MARSPGPTQNFHIVTDVTGDKSVLRNPKQNAYLDNLFDGGAGTALAGHFQFGSDNVTPGVGNASAGVSITFPVPFTSPPTIATSDGSTNSGESNIIVTIVTATGFEVTFYKIDGTFGGAEVLVVNWIAVGDPA